MQIMNRLIRTKLKSRSGASLVLAILVFLICALVGSTVLAAAGSASGTITNTWEADRQVYLMKSAAEMFNPGFEGKIWKKSEVKTQADGVKLIVPGTAEMNTLYNAMACVTYNEGSAKQSLTFKVGSAPVTVSDVKAEVTMDDSYNVTAVFTMDGSVRSVTAYISASTETGSDTRTKGTSVLWNQAVITVQ